MAMPRYAAKRDASEPEIFQVLRKFGFSIEPMDKPVDALVGFRGRTFLVEIKTGRKGYGKALNKNQQEFADTWRGSQVVVLHDVQEATAWAVAISGGRTA